MSLDLAMSLRMGTRHGKHGGGPPPGYTTAAVHFAGATDVSTSSLVATDGATAAFSMWINLGTDNPFLTYWVTDPANNFNNFLVGGPGGALDLGFFDATDNSSVESNPHTTVLTQGVWANVMGMVDTNHPAGQKILNIYVGDADVTGAVTDSNDAFSLVWNALSFHVASDGTNIFTGDMADVWIAPNQFIDFSVTANRRKFISASGKPVDLGVAGATPTGTAPAIFLRRAPSAAASTFATNLGTGGNFTITGALTAASSSPSD